MTDHLGYLIIFCLTGFMNGILLQAPGSIIPFLAAQAHVKATNYYYVFITKSVGSVIAALIYKLL